MQLQNKKIAIIGGGPGGLTLARLLQQQGLQVKVYERDLNREARVQGSPLDLHETSGLAALIQAGLLNEFKSNFMPGADRKKIMNERADVFFSDHDHKLEENFGNPGFRPEIDRGVLRKILLESLHDNTVVWDSHFIAMNPMEGAWQLHFKNGTPAEADLVVAADGANSKIRPYLTDIRPFYSGITMLEGNIDEAEKTAPKISALLNGGKIMAFGKNKNLLMGQKGNGEIGFYASFRASENWALESGLDFNNRTQLLEWFKAHYSEWDSVWQELFESASVPFIPRPIYCMPLDQSWAPMSNLTMIGDAAHVMPPFAGEGVNMAMRDALELSECLSADRCDTLQEAIANFEAGMRQRASEAARESLANGETMHSENALITMLEFFKSH